MPWTDSWTHCMHIRSLQWYNGRVWDWILVIDISIVLQRFTIVYRFRCYQVWRNVVSFRSTLRWWCALDVSPCFTYPLRKAFRTVTGAYPRVTSRRARMRSQTKTQIQEQYRMKPKCFSFVEYLLNLKHLCYSLFQYPWPEVFRRYFQGYFRLRVLLEGFGLGVYGQGLPL